MSVEVRPVRAAEHAQVGRIVLQAYDEVGRMSPDYRRELADTGARIDDETGVLVAVEAGRVLGTITVASTCSVHFEHPGVGDGGFRALAVAPDAQGRGVGRTLVEHSLAHGREYGWRRTVITTMAWMHAAQRLYEDLGFERRADLDVRFPTGVGLAYARDLHDDAAACFPPPGPVPDEPPWYEDAWADRPDSSPC